MQTILKSLYIYIFSNPYDKQQVINEHNCGIDMLLNALLSNVQSCDSQIEEYWLQVTSLGN